MKTFIIPMALVGAIAAVTPVFAENQGGKRDHAARFEALDADSNGEITLEEFQTQRASRFSDVDANGDGFLGKEELLAAGRKRNEERFDRMLSRFDANKDGQLSLDELPQPRNSEDRFARLDKDNSGGLSLEELQQARQKRHKRRKNSDGDDG